MLLICGRDLQPNWNSPGFCSYYWPHVGYEMFGSKGGLCSILTFPSEFQRTECWKMRQIIGCNEAWDVAQISLGHSTRCTLRSCNRKEKHFWAWLGDAWHHLQYLQYLQYLEAWLGKDVLPCSSTGIVHSWIFSEECLSCVTNVQTQGGTNYEWRSGAFKLVHVVLLLLCNAGKLL